MRRLSLLFYMIITVATHVAARGEPPRNEPVAARRYSSPASVSEARDRARLLHEMIHGSLQIMHRDFFDDEDPSAIPSASLEDVFHEMSRTFQVDIKWLNVNTDVVNVDHQPENEFEQDAAKRLALGDEFFEGQGEGRYRFAGAIRLRSECLKCHVKMRRSNKDRTAGLIITMPIEGN